MKRNSKGFTLVELLGAIVILGILIGVSVPIIVTLLDTSRNKMYINDAKKLVAQAEYKLKSNSSIIEKPDKGDCIAVSLVYLDSSDFDNPPNEGSYEKESSFVIIKNNNGKLEYSVTIVEKLKKGGYKGVELVRDSKLNDSDAINHVVSFKKSELINVETDVNKNYINEKLGNGYISDGNNITAIYNYPDLDDSSTNNDIAGTPRITMASLISTSNKGFNSLDATLQLKVEDKDTPRSNLQIFLAIDSGYESATTPIPYGDNDVFSYNINFANYGKSYDGGSVKLYIIVKDPEGNSTKKTMTYKIHKNELPEIDDSSTITKRNNDKVNMTTGLIKLFVSDDIDNNDALKVCFKESSTNEEFNSCDNYVNYDSYFNSENVMEYSFNTCNGGCTRDGSTHYLTIFVKDSLGGVTKKKFSYTFSLNTAPEISTLSVESQSEEFTDNSSKTIVINVNATDDIDNSDQLNVKVEDGISSNTYSYSSQPIYHVINSNYDGSTKTIKISVVDSEGASTSRTKTYTLYKNKKPTIKSYEITSSAVCNNQALCPPEDGGSKNVSVLLDAEDDIDYENNYSNLSVCLSLDENSCNDYVSYSEFYDKAYSYEIDSDYDGTTKNIYVYVKDTYGEIAKQSYSYKIYRNQPPVIDFATITSIDNGNPSINNLNTIFRINAYDDFDDISLLKLQVIEDGLIKINDANLSDYINKDNSYVLSGNYDGQNRNIEVKVIDKEGLITSKEIVYGVYNNKAPEVNMYNVYSKEIPCNNELYCSIDNNGNINAYYKIKVSDDLDSNENIEICVSENNSCDVYSSYSNYLDNEGNPKEFIHTFSVSDVNKPYNGDEKHLYLFVKDSNGKITTKDKLYKLYKNKSPIILGSPTLIGNGGVNALNATYSILAVDDIDEFFKIKYCNKKDGGEEFCTDYEDYQESKVLDSSFFNVSKPNGETYLVYAKLKDNYDDVTTSEEIEYKLIKDKDPLIFYTDIANGQTIYKNSNGDVVESLDGVDSSEYQEYNRLKVIFSIDDPYDNYSICISENNTCNNYSGSYIGNNCNGEGCTVNRKEYSVYYDKLGSINAGDQITLYLYVKDSYNNVTKGTIFEGNYTVCNEKDVENAQHEYEFNEELTNSNLGHNDPISIDRCEGKCYYYNPNTSNTHEIYSYYKSKIKYTDKFNNKVPCNNGNPEVSNYLATCDFKDCFYKNNNYTRKAIGTNLIEDIEPWTININGTDYNCTGYYNLYLSNYTIGKENITLTKTNTMICNSAFDDGVYNYDSNSNDPYVIVVD